jgi:hypothetical protein
MKKKYITPKLSNLGKVSKLTLKSGSQSDFGGNRFQP